MSLQWLTEPVSDEEVCGPDLDTAYDEAFADYYFEAEDRLPQSYYIAPIIDGSGNVLSAERLFDPKSMRAAEEKKKIVALLRRSRDLRLLSLLARQQILAGQLDGFAEALDAMATLLEVHPDAVHPRATSDRRAAFEDLGRQNTVIQPLHYLNLSGAGEVTYRRYLAAIGESDKRPGEEDVTSGALISELAAPGNRAAVDRMHGLLSAAAEALTRISGACLRGDQPFTPAFASTLKTIEDMHKLIATARSDLQPWAATASNSPALSDDALATATADPAPAPLASPPVQPAAAAPVSALVNQSAARKALEAVERYFARKEPSSAALLLVTQARLLVGKPLIEAIETLLPEQAAFARIDFGPEPGFVMPMERLRMLSQEMAQLNTDPPAEDPGPPPVVETRAQAAAQLGAIEAWFRANEPASPIPMLTARARLYMDRDFTALMAEIMPAQGGA